MNLIPARPTLKGRPESFLGDVYLDPIVDGPGPARIYTVRFAPGARTAWHSHANGQTLHIVAGIALVQSRGGELMIARPGDTIYTPPGEWHWHGAAPGHFMVHTAIWEVMDGPNTVHEAWGEHVSDDDFQLPHGL